MIKCCCKQGCRGGSGQLISRFRIRGRDSYEYEWNNYVYSLWFATRCFDVKRKSKLNWTGITVLRWTAQLQLQRICCKKWRREKRTNAICCYVVPDSCKSLLQRTTDNSSFDFGIGITIQYQDKSHRLSVHFLIKLVPFSRWNFFLFFCF